MEQLNVQKGVRACCSAPQFGVNRRIIAFTDVILENDQFRNAEKYSQLSSWYVYMNPRITAKSKNQIENLEESASIPFLIGRVNRLGLTFRCSSWPIRQLEKSAKRHRWVELQAIDVTTGKQIKQVYDGATSIVVQSMMDTLDGIHYIDRTKNFGFNLTPDDQKRLLFRTKIRWFMLGTIFSLFVMYTGLLGKDDQLSSV